MGESGSNGYDADDEVFASCAVHKGDKVMIQSKVTGKLKSSLSSHHHHHHCHRHHHYAIFLYGSPLLAILIMYYESSHRFT